MRIHLIFLLLLLFGIPSYAQSLEIDSRSVQLPILTNKERNKLTELRPGQIIYNVDTHCIEVFNGSIWYNICEHSYSETSESGTNSDRLILFKGVELDGDGLQLPKMTFSERDAIEKPRPGETIYNINSDCIEIFRSDQWYSLCDGGYHSSVNLNLLLGGELNDVLYSIDITEDGGYIAGGYTRSDHIKVEAIEGTNHGVSDIIVLHLDAKGHLKSGRILGGDRSDIATSIKSIENDGFIICGRSRSSISGDVTQASNGNFEFWIVRLDMTGEIIWDKLLGGLDRDEAQYIQLTTDSCLIMVGHSYSSESGDVTETTNGYIDAWIVKLDLDGNKIWDRLIGGENLDQGYCIEPTADDGFIMVGRSFSSMNGDIPDSSRGSSDFWIVKLDAEGNIEWSKLAGGDDREEARSVKQTPDGGFIVAGTSYSSVSGDIQGVSHGYCDYWILKLDAIGDIEWERLLGGSGDDLAFDIQVLSDGSFIIAGDSRSSASGDVSKNTNGGQDAWIVKVDNQGSVIWDRLLGGSKDDFARSIKETPDHGLIVAGYSWSSKSGDIYGTSKGDLDTWIIKLDSVGHIQN